MTNSLNILKKLPKKNKIKVRSFGYTKESDIKFINLKKINKSFLLQLSVDKKSFFLKIKNQNKNYIMNILSCISVMTELNLSINKVKNCLSTYRKKKEFNGGYLEIKDLVCKNYESFSSIDKYSKIIEIK